MDAADKEKFKDYLKSEPRNTLYFNYTRYDTIIQDGVDAITDRSEDQEFCDDVVKKQLMTNWNIAQNNDPDGPDYTSARHKRVIRALSAAMYAKFRGRCTEIADVCC